MLSLNLLDSIYKEIPDLYAFTVSKSTSGFKFITKHPLKNTCWIIELQTNSLTYKIIISKHVIDIEVRSIQKQTTTDGAHIETHMTQIYKIFEYVKALHIDQIKAILYKLEDVSGTMIDSELWSDIE